MTKEISLKKAFELFLISRETYCTDETVNNYRNTLRYLITFLEGHFSRTSEEIIVQQITRDDLNDYVLYLRNKTKNENHPFKPLTTEKITKRTIRTYSIDMRTFFNFLFDEEYISNNPMKKFKMIKSEKKAIIPINSDEVYIMDDMFDISTRRGCRNLLIVHLLLDEGMRSSEVCKLKLVDLHLGEDFLVIRNGKGSKDRVLPLSHSVKKYLTRYLESFRPQAEHDHVLCTISGEPITNDVIKSLFARIKEKTKLQRLHPHLLRHTFATSFLCGGGSLSMLRIYMGHADIKTTENYLHLVNAMQFCKNIYRLDQVFFQRLY